MTFTRLVIDPVRERDSVSPSKLLCKSHSDWTNKRFTSGINTVGASADIRCNAHRYRWSASRPWYSGHNASLGPAPGEHSCITLSSIARIDPRNFTHVCCILRANQSSFKQEVTNSRSVIQGELTFEPRYIAKLVGQSAYVVET